jgi:hypothetical protein
LHRDNRLSFAIVTDGATANEIDLTAEACKSNN